MRNRYLLSSLLLPLLTMCGGVSQNNNDGVIAPIEQTIVSADLKPYLDDIKFIPINESDILLPSISKMKLDRDGNMFIISKEGVVALNSDGTFMRVIGRRGRGPREYRTVRDLCISVDGEELMVLDYGKVLCYGISDTTAFREFTYPEMNADAIAPSKDGGAYIFSAYPTTTLTTAESAERFLLTQVDGSGHVVANHVQNEDFTFSIANITQVSGNRYYVRPQNSKHIVYEITPDSLERVHAIDFKDKTIPARYYFDVANEDMGAYMTAPYYKVPVFFSETEDNLYFKAITKDQEINYLYSLSGRNGVNWANVFTEPQFSIIASDDDYFYTTVTASDMEGYNSANPESHSALFRLVAESFVAQGVVGSGDNPIIVKMKFDI